MDTLPKTVGGIARTIDPHKAQLALAQIMVIMGASAEWDSETIESVGMLVIDATPAGYPTFIDTLGDEDAYEYWQSIL